MGLVALEAEGVWNDRFKNGFEWFLQRTFFVIQEFKDKIQLGIKGVDSIFCANLYKIDPIGSALAFGPNYNILTDRLRNHFFGLWALQNEYFRRKHQHIWFYYHHTFSVHGIQ